MAEEEIKAPQDEVEEEEDELKEEVVCEEGAPGWVVTFGDMMSLLLTFFILLLSFATLDRVQFDKLSGVLQEGFGTISRTDTQRIPKRDSNIKVNQRVNRNSRSPNSASDEIKRIRQAINGSSVQDKTKRALETLVDANEVKVSLPADDVFVPGTDQIRPSIYPLLKLLAVQASTDALADKDLAIEVRAGRNSPCEKPFRNLNECDYWLMTSYQAIAISRYFAVTHEMNRERLIPVGRGTAKPSFVSKRDREGLSSSTVEFIYMDKPINLNRPRP